VSVKAESIQLLPERDKRVLQLHVDAPKGLEDLADELTEVTMRALEMTGEPDVAVLHAALREFLHQHVTAGDVCGLSTFCWGMPLLDPWDAGAAER
jgi:hypothetical protein